MTVEECCHQSNLAETRGRTLPAQISIKHWQLRNLLCRDQTDENIGERLLYCCRYNIRTLNVETNQTGLLSNQLTFEPRSLVSAPGYTIAGSENGTIALVDKSMRKIEYSVGGSLINGLHVYNANDGQARVVVANNDHSLKLFNLHSRRTETSLGCPAAMNHASVSSNGQMMAAVGDSTQVYLYINESGRWRKHAELRVAEDACFSSVFSPSQQYLAIGSQDGSCTILDVRRISNNLHDLSLHSPVDNQDTALVYRAQSSRSFPHGAIRSISWSPSCLDMLLYTESTAYATLLDCRNFSNQQRIRIPDGDGSHFGIGGRDRDITGACWSGSNGNRIYIGSEQGISEFGIKTRSRRTFPSSAMR